VSAMSKCQDLEPLLASYVDGESAAGARVSVEAHLERCPPCRQRVAGERAAREAVCSRRAWLRPCASEHLRARCAAHRMRRSGLLPLRARAWVPLSLAATLILAVAGAFVFGLNDNVEAVAAQLTLDHVRCFQLAPERLTHADAAAAGRDWAASQGWALHVPASSPSADLELLGVRRCVTASGATAHLLYKWRGEPLSVFVLPRTLRHHPQVDEIVESFGHEAVMWSARDRTYVVLADGRPADLAPVIGYMKTQAR
jgi:anti-sigma factor RsiW